jgi:predicted 3-demethylubiquinone-9 3-methyltransferase (glyoxalase superfamily)
MPSLNKSIYPCLWFDNQAKEAADFYCSIFRESRITEENPMVVRFEVNGFRIMALNGGPQFKFNEAASLVVECGTQEEIDYYWDRLTEGGTESQCGWLKDKFGFSWQIVPSILGQLMSDPERSDRVIQAFLKMKKFDIEALKNA